MALAAIILIGGGRRLLWSWRRRKAVARLADPGVTPEEIEAVAAFGRSGAWELLRVFSTTESEPLRLAAGRALARLWRDDQLVAEEEQAIIRRGYSVTWSARRRYPRSMHAELPIAASYDIPFLPDDPDHVSADDLEWSHRIVGARRAALEEFSRWSRGRGQVAFSIVPDDFPTNGPHRLVLQTRVRTAGLSDAWEIELPHVPFQFDFDPVLRLDAILTLSDSGRDEAMARAIRLESVNTAIDEPARLLPLGVRWVMRNPPRLAVETPLPSDLAHRVSVEFEGASARVPAGALIVSGQGLAQDEWPGNGTKHPAVRRRPDRALPGGRDRSARARGVCACTSWRTPSSAGPIPRIRSVWPGTIETNWVEAEIIRM